MLLSDIISIYLHLDCPTFIAALARDDRSYSAGIFNKASRILEGRNLKSPDEIAKLHRLVHKVEDVRQQGAADEEELGEVPTSFWVITSRLTGSCFLFCNIVDREERKKTDEAICFFYA